MPTVLCVCLYAAASFQTEGLCPVCNQTGSVECLNTPVSRTKMESTPFSAGQHSFPERAFGVPVCCSAWQVTITEVSKVSVVPVSGELLLPVVWSTVHSPPSGAQVGNRGAVTRESCDLLQPLYPVSPVPALRKRLTCSCPTV